MCMLTSAHTALPLWLCPPALTQSSQPAVWLRKHHPDPSLSDVQSPVAGALHPMELWSYPYTQQAAGPLHTLWLRCSTTELQKPSKSRAGDLFAKRKTTTDDFM